MSKDTKTDPGGGRPEDSIPAPPYVQRPYYRLVTASHQHEQRLTLLSDWELGRCSHYHDGQTVACVAQYCPCLLCERGLVQRWRAYFAALPWKSCRPVLLEITWGAWHYCPELQALRGQLRGRNVLLGRTARFKRAGVKIVLLEGVTHSDGLPPAFDVAAYVMQRWGLVEPKVVPAGRVPHNFP